MHVSEDEFRAWERTHGASVTPPASPDAAARHATAKTTASAKGDVERMTTARRGRMNKSESNYAAHLQSRLLAGEIVWWAFEPFRFRIGENANYSPDFGVMLPDGLLELHEAKGHRFEAGIVRLKAAEELYPMFRWWIVKKLPGGGYRLVKPSHKNRKGAKP